MDRREFIKLSGLFSVAFFTQFIPRLGKSINQPVELASGGVIYRGTQGGDIQTSGDAGLSWQLHTRLGPQYSIISLYSDSSTRVYTKAVFAGRSFELMLSKDKKYWLTV